MLILAFVDDLLFSSKIRSTARSLGIDVYFIRSLDERPAESAGTTPQLAVVDMSARSFDPLAVISALKEMPPAPRVLAFVSHVRADLVDAAREAGADEVLARSAFAANLADILRTADE